MNIASGEHASAAVAVDSSHIATADINFRRPSDVSDTATKIYQPAPTTKDATPETGHSAGSDVLPRIHK